MTMPKTFKVLEKYLLDNSTSILTGLAVAGTVTTAVLTGRAAYKSYALLNEACYDSSSDEEYIAPRILDLGEKFSLLWRLYIPAVSTGVLTCVAVVGVNRIGNRRAAAMAAAYKLSETAFSDYREKVIQTIGEKKAAKVRSEVLQDQVSKNPDTNREILDEEDGRVRTYDSLSGRYFWSDMEKIRRAENAINQKIIQNDYASLTEFYSEIGLAPNALSEELGWNSNQMLEVIVETVLDHNDKPCLAVEYRTEPVRNYYRVH